MIFCTRLPRHFLTMIVGGLTFFHTASVMAAVLDSLEGAVFINRGTGFTTVEGTTELNAGDLVLVSEGGEARIVYYEGCTETVEPDRVSVVASVAPCSSGTTGSTSESSNVSANSAANNGVATKGTDYIIGAAVIGGAAAAIVLLTQDDSTSNTSDSSLAGGKANGCENGIGKKKGCTSAN